MNNSIDELRLQLTAHGLDERDDYDEILAIIERYGEAIQTELLDALDAIVTAAAPDGTQEDGDFVGFYVMSTGELHKAIPILQKYKRYGQPIGDPKLKSRYQAKLSAIQTEARIDEHTEVYNKSIQLDFNSFTKWSDRRITKLAELTAIKEKDANSSM